MIRQTLDENHDDEDPRAYLPTPAEIEAGCAEAQAQWSNLVREGRWSRGRAAPRSNPVRVEAELTVLPPTNQLTEKNRRPKEKPRKRTRHR